MTSLGNTELNRIWQSGGGAELPTLGPATPSAQREAAIRAKYEARSFVDPNARPPPASLHRAALTDDALLAAKCLAHRFKLDEPAPSTPTAATVRAHRA